MKMRYTDGNHPQQGLAPYVAQRPMAQPWQFADPMAMEPDADTRIDWAGYWRSVTKRKWPILIAAVALTIAATLYAQSILPVFRSTTTVLIESGKTKILSSIEEVYNGASQDREYYQTQVEILRSRDVALRTVVSTRLWDEPEFDPRTPSRGWVTRLRELISSPPAPLPWTPERLANETVGRYLASIAIEPVRLSQLVKISFEAHDRELAAKVADATALAFIESDRDSRLKLNLSATGLLQDRLVALRERLLQSEQELQKYRESAGLVSVGGSGSGVAAQQLSEVSQRLVSARVRRTELESAYQQVDRGGNGGDSSQIAAVIAQPGVADARARVAVAQAQVDEVTRTLGEQNSKVIEARAVLAAAQRGLQAQTRAVVASMRAEMQAARQTEGALQTQLTAARSSVQGVNRQEFQLGVLEREVQTNKQLYELFLSRTKETSVSTNLQSANARIVDPAIPAGVPLRPNKPQIVLATLLLTLLGGATVSVLKDRLTNTMQGSDEAENRLQHPVLATLPKVRSTSAAMLSRSLIDNPKSVYADAIRMARTGMLLSKFAVAQKVILITSAVTGEGKTTFSTNLAAAHAQTRRTLLIDCDLRNPQVGARLGLPADAKGISELIAGTADVKDCVHSIPDSSLLVMPAGELPAHPEELLLSPQFRESLKALANRVDIVLIDAPPVGAGSDALIIAQQANDTIFVVKARDTPHLLAQRGIERLRRAGASIMGVVLTNVETPTDRTSRYYGTGFRESRLADENTVIAA